jgi:hypothetical protein
MTDKPYDVALSFFARDLATARELYERLNQELRVFFFERAQDELTGREGDEVFRTPFRDARLSVVLLRPGYGERMWTGVERTAIGEACLERGYKNLFAVRMEKMQLPNWIPSTHIYHDLEVFPIEQLVGAIKAKVIELGGRPEPMTPEKRARMFIETQKFEAERKKFRSEGQGIQQFVAELAVLFGEIEAKCKALAETGVKLEQAHSTGRCVIRDETVSMAVYCRFSGYGQVEYEVLTVEEYKVRTELPNERWGWIEGRPSPSKTEKYELELTPSRAIAWKATNDNDLFSSKVLGDKIVIRFFEWSEQVTKDRNRRRSQGWP